MSFFGYKKKSAKVCKIQSRKDVLKRSSYNQPIRQSRVPQVICRGGGTNIYIYKGATSNLYGGGHKFIQGRH